MSMWVQVVLPVLLGLAVNECSDISPWLAGKVVRCAARIRRPDRAEGLAEELAALIDIRPGKLFKLFTALGFLFAAMARRVIDHVKADREPAHTQEDRPGLGWLMRVRLTAATVAGLLSAATWNVIGSIIRPDAFNYLQGNVIFGGGLLLLTLLVLLLPSPASPARLVCVTLLPTAALAALIPWIDRDLVDPWAWVCMAAPVCGIAHVVRVLLRHVAFSAAAGSVLAAATALAALVGPQMSQLGTYDPIQLILPVMTGVGVLAGLHMGIGLLAVEFFTKRRRTAFTEPDGENDGEPVAVAETSPLTTSSLPER